MSRGACAVAVAILLIVAVGCSRDHSAPIAPPAELDSIARAPSDAIRLFEAGWVRGSVPRLGALLADGFRFVPGVDDTGTVTLDRAEFLAATDNLFATAEHIDCEFDENLIAFPDSRPGKEYPWHVESASSLALRVDLGDAAIDIRGEASFHLVRGDSAQAPGAARGDSTRWYIDRIEDHSCGGSPRPVPDSIAETQPARCLSWARLLAQYRD